MTKRASDIHCELFQPQNEGIAHDRLKKRLRKHLGSNVTKALQIAKKAVMTPELLTEDEKAFHQKIMSSERKFNNA